MLSRLGSFARARQAGPGTIAEAAAAALPVVVTSYLPGQEAGNVHFVVENGFGTLRKKPAAIADVVSRWLQSPALLRKMSMNARAVAMPEASGAIAHDIAEMLFGPAPASAPATARLA